MKRHDLQARPNRGWYRGPRPRKKGGKRLVGACRRCGRLLRPEERADRQCESCDYAEYSEAFRDLTSEFE